MKAKNSWLAVNLSMFFPGIGQLYAGKTQRGIFWIAIELFLIMIAFWSIFSPNGNTVMGLGILPTVVALYFVNLFDAYGCIYNQSSKKSSEKIPRKYKDPWFAVFLSRLLPGLGHLYLGKAILGMLFIALFIILGIFDSGFPLLSSFTPVVTAVGAYHTYMMFPRSQSSSSRSLIAIIAAFVVALGLISNSLPTWITQDIEPFNIPSESMTPTLQIGDRIFVTAHHNYTPSNGDVIVFEAPEVAKDPNSEYLDENGKLYYVKRVIGTPGQTIAIRDGVVSVNGIPLQENYIEEPTAYRWGPQIIPNDSYFVLGDNRNNSYDSHSWGFLPKSYVLGPAYKIYWPPERIQSLLKS